MALVPFPKSPSKGTRGAQIFDGLLDKVSVLELLEQFRRLLVHSALAVSVGVLAGFLFINRVVDFILGPTRRSPTSISSRRSSATCTATRRRDNASSTRLG